MQTATVTAPTFTVSRRGPVRGRTDADLATLPNDVDVIAIATIATVKVHGTGGSLRATLGLAADNGAVAVATIDADTFPQVPDFLRRPGVRVRVWGAVKRLPGMPVVIDVIGIGLPDPD